MHNLHFLKSELIFCVLPHKANMFVEDVDQLKVVEMEVRKNGLNFGKADLITSYVDPHATLEMAFDGKSLDAFIGMKQSNLIHFSVTSKSSSISETTEEIEVTIELSDDGRIMTTEIDWRPQLFDDISQTLAKTKVSLFDERIMACLMRHSKTYDNAVRSTVQETFDDIIDGLDIDSDSYKQIVLELKDNLATLYVFTNNLVDFDSEYLQEVMNYATDMSLFMSVQT